MNANKLFFVLLISLSIAGCHTDDVKNTYTISGKVSSVLIGSSTFGEIDTLQFTVNLISDDQIIATSDDGIFTFTGMEEGKSYIVIPEQLENEGIGMSALDYAMVDQYIKGGEVLDAFQKLAADVNKDNLINTTDLELIRNCLLDTKQCFYWRFATDDYDGSGIGQADQYIINNLMSDVTINLFPINTGDISGTHDPH